MAVQEPGSGRHLGLGLRDGEVVLFVSSGRNVIVPTGPVLAEMAWHCVSVAFDPTRAVAQVELVELAPRRGAIARGRVSVSVPEAWPQVPALSLTSFGALLSPEPAFFLDGQLEAPRVAAGRPPDLVASLGALGIAPDRALAAWDFASDMTSQSFADRGPGALHGAFVNLPTRAMKGSNWSGREMAWRHAPDEYGAAHFHSDDVGDVGWRESLQLTIPEDLPSGVYALRVDNGLASDHIPFFCTAARETAERGEDRLPGLDPHLPRLCEPCPGQLGCSVPGPGRGMGGEPQQSRPGPRFRLLDLQLPS